MDDPRFLSANDARAMTDLERFVAAYEAAGVRVDVDFDPDGGEQSIMLEAGGSCDKILGYCGHSTKLTFSRDGKFLHQGIWD